MPAAISITNIQKSFGSLSALRNISLDIQQGEFFGLLGPNGAGKSTLLNIIAGLTRPDNGEVFVDGYNIVSNFKEARLALGVVPQELVFDPFFSVREILIIQSGYYGLGNENLAWIDELIERLKLTDKANTNLRALSGGMKRRVLIAMALVHKPPVIILDEPTAGVDVELRRTLWAFIKELHENGHTIVLTTHYLEEAEMLCDQIAIINRGKIIEHGSKQLLLNSQRKKNLIVRTADVMNEQRIPKLLTSYITITGEYSLLIEVSSSLTIPVVLNALAAEGIDIVDLSTEESDLEDHFIQLIESASP